MRNVMEFSAIHIRRQPNLVYEHEAVCAVQTTSPYRNDVTKVTFGWR